MELIELENAQRQLEKIKKGICEVDEQLDVCRERLNAWGEKLDILWEKLEKFGYKHVRRINYGE